MVKLCCFKIPIILIQIGVFDIKYKLLLIFITGNPFKTKSKKTEANLKNNVVEEVMAKIIRELEREDFYVPGFNCGPSQGGELEAQLEKENVKHRDRDIKRLIVRVVAPKQSNIKGQEFLCFKGFNLQMEFSGDTGIQVKIIKISH